MRPTGNGERRILQCRVVPIAGAHSESDSRTRVKLRTLGGEARKKGGAMQHHDAEGYVLVRAFDRTVTILALLMIVVVILESVATDPGLLLLAKLSGWIVWLGFLAELSVKIVLSSDRLRTMRESWLEVAIILLTPPFIERLEALSPLRTARALRILRFARLALPGLQALRGLRRLFGRHHLAYVSVAMLLVVLSGGITFFLLEGETGTVRHFGDAFWWAVVTVTTVGYGDITPKTGMGRLVALGVMLVGIGFLSVLTANIAAYFLEVRQETAEAAARDQLAAIEAKLTEVMAVLQRHTNMLDSLSAGSRDRCAAHRGAGSSKGGEPGATQA